MRLRSFGLPILSVLCWFALPMPLRSQSVCEDPRPRIVGGEDTDIKDHPWQVALVIDGKFCGGVIISDNWLLTAAHCFDSDDAKKVKVKSGVTNFRVGGAWSAADRVVLHKYDAKTQEYDLALVKLTAPPAGVSIPLARPDLELKQCQHLEVTGWGHTKEKGAGSETLRKATVPYVDNTVCNARDSYDNEVRPSMMCAGFYEIDACQGDSGGPLVFQRPNGPVLVGIVSWGDGCGRKLKYGVYTRVSAHHDWITKVIASDGRN